MRTCHGLLERGETIASEPKLPAYRFLETPGLGAIVHIRRDRNQTGTRSSHNPVPNFCPPAPGEKKEGRSVADCVGFGSVELPDNEGGKNASLADAETGRPLAVKVGEPPVTGIGEGACRFAGVASSAAELASGGGNFTTPTAGSNSPKQLVAHIKIRLRNFRDFIAGYPPWLVRATERSKKSLFDAMRVSGKIMNEMIARPNPKTRIYRLELKRKFAQIPNPEVPYLRTVCMSVRSRTSVDLHS